MHRRDDQRLLPAFDQYHDLTHLLQGGVHNLVLRGCVVAAVHEERQSRVRADEGLGRIHHIINERRLHGAVGVVERFLERL